MTAVTATIEKVPHAMTTQAQPGSQTIAMEEQLLLETDHYSSNTRRKIIAAEDHLCLGKDYYARLERTIRSNSESIDAKQSMPSPMPWDMSWTGMAYLMACQGICNGTPQHVKACFGICHGMPWHIQWQAMAYALACAIKCHCMCKGML